METQPNQSKTPSPAEPSVPEPAAEGGSQSKTVTPPEAPAAEGSSPEAPVSRSFRPVQAFQLTFQRILAILIVFYGIAAIAALLG